MKYRKVDSPEEAERKRPGYLLFDMTCEKADDPDYKDCNPSIPDTARYNPRQADSLYWGSLDVGPSTLQINMRGSEPAKQVLDKLGRFDFVVIDVDGEQFKFSADALLAWLSLFDCNAKAPDVRADCMPLPKDADGAPIHVGDELTTSELGGLEFRCSGFCYETAGYSEPRWSIACEYDDRDGTTQFVDAKSCRHVDTKG